MQVEGTVSCGTPLLSTAVTTEICRSEGEGSSDVTTPIVWEMEYGVNDVVVMGDERYRWFTHR